MADVVVSCPKAAWQTWSEQAASGLVVFDLGYRLPGKWNPGDRVYVVAHGRVRCWMELGKVGHDPITGQLQLVLIGQPLPVTTSEEIRGFQGARMRWWPRDQERDFPGWREP